MRAGRITRVSSGDARRRNCADPRRHQHMLDNIDNYASYMWNRWQDRNYGVFKF